MTKARRNQNSAARRRVSPPDRVRQDVLPRGQIMKWPHATLTDQQAKDTYFIVPEIPDAYTLALGSEGYRQFRQAREVIRAAGGELLLIGWPDGTTITYHRLDASRPIDLDNVVATYRASAALHRAFRVKAG
jgi:hypothetical protein